jgi:hypothetical protein
MDILSRKLARPVMLTWVVAAIFLALPIKLDPTHGFGFATVVAGTRHDPAPCRGHNWCR